MDRRSGLIDRILLVIHLTAVTAILLSAVYIYTVKESVVDTGIGVGLLATGLYMLYHLAKVTTINDYWPRRQ